ncbi:MAG TPA: hypothetical protein VEJ63_02390, partial [Planctomycetota bacterium]|nr:hypothetical protein [Planctomycetota bacterium]
MTRISYRSLHLAPAILLTTCFSLLAAEPAPVQKLADVLPDGTIMYAELAPWSKWSKDMGDTAIAKIFAEPEVRQFLAGPFSQIS